MKLTDYQMDVMCNILAAVETGGQVYGKGRWDDFTEAGKNSSNEKAITIGCYQFYGTNAKELLNKIRKDYPAKFQQLDTEGIANDLDHKDWSTYKLSKTSDKAKCIQKIISSQVGIIAQKALMAEQITVYINRAVTEGVTSVQAAMFCANIQHLGGKGPVQRIIKKCGTPLTIERLFSTLAKDQKDASSNNQVGDSLYWSRHVKVYGWIKEKIQEGDDMSISVVLAGHGSGKPSTKGMNAYCKSRYAAGRGLVEVLRLDISDQQRQQMHDNYATLLGRNIYSQSLRDFCYKAYNGKYYSDCSSSICRTAQRVGVSGVSSLNTAGMHYNWRKVLGVKIENGIIQNPEILKVGDALMFKGSDSSRPLQIGHTEMVYEINGTNSYEDSSLIMKGQMQLNNFVHAGLKVDGEKGPLTKAAAIEALQKALNLDYEVGLVEDGKLGSKTKAKAKKIKISKGKNGYCVTVLEILFLINGIDPKGVEYPGIAGDGLDTAIRSYRKKKKWPVSGIAGSGTVLSLLK